MGVLTESGRFATMRCSLQLLYTLPAYPALLRVFFCRLSYPMHSLFFGHIYCLLHLPLLTPDLQLSVALEQSSSGSILASIRGMTTSVLSSITSQVASFRSGLVIPLLHLYNAGFHLLPGGQWSDSSTW